MRCAAFGEVSDEETVLPRKVASVLLLTQGCLGGFREGKDKQEAEEAEMRFTLLAGLVTILAPVTPIQAQTSGAPRGFFDITMIGAQPTGEFGANVDQGWGLEFGARYRLDPAGLVSLRGSLGFINYGNETLEFCSVYSCRVGIDLDTRNNILFLGVGPEVAIQMGPIRPYARVAVGLGYFVTTSGLSGSDDWSGHSYASTNNYEDVVFQKRLGTGLGIRLSNGWRPVWLDIGADYHNNGMASYLREGDIVDQPDGSVVIYPQRSEANLWTFRVGVSIGFGREGGRRGDQRNGR